jgi:hypothetical protein
LDLAHLVAKEIKPPPNSSKTVNVLSITVCWSSRIVPLNAKSMDV